MNRNGRNARQALTKTQPDETPILTRTAPAEDRPAVREDSRDILDAIDAAMEEHADWLRKWHRAVVCGLPPAREVVSKHAHYLGRFGSWFDIHSSRNLLDQPVFQELWSAHVEKHERGRSLALKAIDGEPLPARDYDAFMEKVDRFSAIARRIRDAFQRAVFDLDPLTGVHNRRSMISELSRERDRSLRTGSPFCIGLCDIDHFKSVNDRFGHGVGDVVLLSAVGRLIANLRPYDSIYRYGGEEFLLALPNTDNETAQSIAGRLRQALSKSPISANDDVSLTITASFGLCMVDGSVSLEETIERADRALYRAKDEGRDRVVLWTDGMTDDPQND